MGSPGASAGAREGRVAFFDTLRGAALVSMCAFHTCYDLAYLYGWSMPWFTAGPVRDAWCASISWTFLLLAGWMTACSRSNLKRACRYGAAAILVFVATSIASVDTAVNFGILYCMAACTLVFVIVQPALNRVPAPVGIAVLLLCFFATYGVPRSDYELAGLAWLGFPSASFSSGDYYPLIPYVFLYLAGALGARWHREARGGAYPACLLRDWCPPLTWIGRHSLLVYLLHQPIVLVVLELLL